MNDLKSIFGPAYINNLDDASDPQAFFWFRSKTGGSFGIRKTGITDKELLLLRLHYILVEEPRRTLTPNQQAWADLLFEEHTSASIDLKDQLTQFIFLHFKSILSDISSFEEAILGYFPEETTILWPDPQLAVLILSMDPNELLSGEDLIELINTDFYVSAKMFFGAPFKEIRVASTLFQEEKSAFERAQRAYPDKYVFSYKELVPFLMIEPFSDKLPVFFTALSAYLDEESDMRFYLETFFDHHLNLSTTAKALFMHRNSLHYRLDKLRDRTGLDPRRFQDALFISFELLFNKKHS